LDRLIGAYPTHGFVIDRAEATELFKNVREPTTLEAHLIDKLGRLSLDPLPESEAIREFLSQKEEDHDDKDDNANTDPGSGDVEDSGTPREGVERTGADSAAPA
jgi:hypothetical protein